MFFKDVIGQQEIKEHLVQSVKDQRVSHTQLFLGPEGSGNLALALAFAQYVNCENKSQISGNEDSCGKCPSCIKSQKMIHPDIHYSFPVIKSKSDRAGLSADFMKQWREAILENPYIDLLAWFRFIDAENKQGNITADECREIIHQLNLKTFESEYKILVMWMAEYLGKEGNILLKLLEEPPEKTLILLVAENRDQLLTTILSRTQIVSIPRIDDVSLLHALIEHHELNREEALKMVRKADGNYSEILRLIGNLEDNNPQLFRKWMLLLVQGQAKELIEWVDEMSRLGRENQKSFFRYGLEFLRECMMLQRLGEEHSRLHAEEKRLANWLAERMSLEDWEVFMHDFDEAHYHIERNAHAKILFMHLSQKLRGLINRKRVFSSV